MRIRTSSRREHFIEFDGMDVNVNHEPAYEDYVLAEIVGRNLVVAYLVHDDHGGSVEDHMGDCMGKLLSFHRHSRDIAEGMEALGMDSAGDKNLDRVWDLHEVEAVRRYVEEVVKAKGLEDLINDLQAVNEDVVDGPTAREHLAADAHSQSYWYHAEYNEIMQAVLEEMWSESAYSPGNVDAVLLDCYSHGSNHWSMSGGGMQCRWDTANGAGVWVPDKYLTKDLDSTQADAVYAYVRSTDFTKGRNLAYQLVQVTWTDSVASTEVVKTSDNSQELYELAKTLREDKPTPTPIQLAWGRERMCSIYCAQFLESYNDIINGNVYGCVVETFELESEEDDAQWVSTGDEDACWGFIGSDYAMESLKSEYFDPTIAALKVPA